MSAYQLYARLVAQSMCTRIASPLVRNVARFGGRLTQNITGSRLTANFRVPL